MGFTNGMPQCGIHDKLFPDEIAQRMREFFEAMCNSMLWTEVDHVIEGEAILPESARSLQDRNPGKVKACFLGYADIDVDEKVREVNAHGEPTGDWLMNESQEGIHRHIENMVGYSRKVRQQCANCNVSYFDTSSDFLKTLDQATQYLLTSPHESS